MSTQVWEFTWKAVGSGRDRDEALEDAQGYVETADPCEEELLEEHQDEEDE